MATLPPYCLAQGRSLQTGAAQTGAAQAAVAQAGASQTGAAQTSAVEGLISGGLKTPPPVLSLSDAWRFAMESDPTLKAANAAALAGREQLPQAQAQLLPNVSMNASRYRNDVRRESLDFLSQAVVSNSRYASKNETLQLRQPLVREVLRTQLRQAGYLVAESDATLEREVQKLAVRVAGAYFELMLARDQAQLLASQAEFLQSRLKAAASAIASGAGTRTDLDDAQARLDLNRAQRLEAAQAIGTKRRQLQALVGRPVGELAILDPTRFSLEAPQPASLEEWLQIAFESSPDVLSARARLNAARENVRQAQAGHYPTLDAVAQWQRSQNEIVNQPQTGYTNTSVGVVLNLPIYAGGYVESTVREARAQEIRQQEVLEATQLDLGVRVQTEFNGVTEGVARVKALEVAARSAEVALESARKSQLAGVRTTLDVLNAEQSRVQTLRDLAQARYELLLSRIRLQSLAGKVDERTFAVISAAL